MARKEYVSVYSKVAADADRSKNSSKKGWSPLTAQEQRRLDELEEELPLQAVVMFRAMARKEVRVVVLLLFVGLAASTGVACCASSPVFLS